jgi:effector-binding domain-containing protein
MKKLKVLVSISLVAIITILSCSKENELVNEQNDITSEILERKGNPITAGDLEFVGIEHNAMLNDIYNYLEKNKNIFEKKDNKENRASLENFLTDKFNPNKNYSEESNELAVYQIKDIFQDEPENLTKVYNDKVEKFLSVKEKYYLEQVGQIVFKSELNDKSFEAKMILIEEQIEKDSTLSDEELITLFSATQTAKYSYAYWSHNSQKWIELSSAGSNIISREGSDGIVAADIAGAIGGAVGAWAVNVAPGVGQVAYGSAILGGAVGNSTIKAVSNFIDWMGW